MKKLKWLGISVLLLYVAYVVAVNLNIDIDSAKWTSFTANKEEKQVNEELKTIIEQGIDDKQLDDMMGIRASINREIQTAIDNKDTKRLDEILNCVGK